MAVGDIASPTVGEETRSPQGFEYLGAPKPVVDKTGNTTLDRATLHGNETFTWASQRLESRRRDFTRRYAQYRGNMNVFGRDTIQTQLRSQIWLNKSAALIEAVLPKTIGDNPTIEIRARHADGSDAAYLMERVLDYYLSAMHFFDVLYFWWKDALIYGTSIIEVPWIVREEDRPSPISPGGFTRKVVEDMPKMVNIDIFDFLFDYASTTIPRMDFVMKKYELPLDIVAARVEQGLYQGVTVDELKAFAGTYHELSDDSYFKDERDRAAYGYLGNEGDQARNRVDQLKKVVLYDYWGRFDLNKDMKDENCYITYLGPRCQKAVRAVRNPYADGQKPFIAAHYIPVSNDFLGVGLMEWLEQLQREMNTRYNMMVDNANYILNAMMLVRRGAGIPDAQLKSRPSGRIDVNEPDDVTPLQMKPIIGELAGVQQWNDQLWQEISGIGSEMSGIRRSAGTAFQRTAGGILALQQAAEARLKMSRLLFEKRSVEPAAELLISRVKQFMTAPVTVSFTGDQGLQYLEIRPEQINATDYDLRVVIAPTEQIGRLAEREKWTTTLAVLTKLDPQMMLFEWGNILEDWMNATGLPNPPRYLGQAKQKLNLIHQMQLMQQMQMDMAGGAPPGEGGGGGEAEGQSPQIGPGAAGGGAGEQIGQVQKEFTAGGKSSEMTQVGGEKGRGAQ